MKENSDGMKPCTICGKIAYLDEINCCSAECGEEAERRFAAQGHTHGLADPPLNEDGEIDLRSCPKFNEHSD